MHYGRYIASAMFAVGTMVCANVAPADDSSVWVALRQNDKCVAGVSYVARNAAQAQKMGSGRIGFFVQSTESKAIWSIRMSGRSWNLQPKSMHAIRFYFQRKGQSETRTLFFVATNKSTLVAEFVASPGWARSLSQSESMTLHMFGQWLPPFLLTGSASGVRRFVSCMMVTLGPSVDA